MSKVWLEVIIFIAETVSETITEVESESNYYTSNITESENKDNEEEDINVKYKDSALNFDKSIKLADYEFLEEQKERIVEKQANIEERRDIELEEYNFYTPSDPSLSLKYKKSKAEQLSKELKEKEKLKLTPIKTHTSPSKKSKTSMKKSPIKHK